MTVTFDIPDEVGFMSYTLVAAEFYGIDHNINILVSGLDPREHKGCVIKMDSITSDMVYELISRDGGDAE